MTDPTSPVPVAVVDNELEAGAIVAALEAEGVLARMVGEFTAGFRAEAPGQVTVVVRQEDLERARQILESLHEEGNPSEGDGDPT